MKKEFFLVLLLLPFLGEAAHITDRLLAGMYASPDTSSELIKLLPSGTPLDILSEKNGLVKVKLVDGKEGWVEKRFLSEDKPAKSRLLVLQSKYKQMQRDFDDTKRELISLQAANATAKDSSGNSAIEKKYVMAQSELLNLKKQLQAMQEKNSSADGVELVHKEEKIEIKALKKQLKSMSGLQREPIDGSPSGFSGWRFVVLVAVVLPLGIAVGAWLQDVRQRKKHGGFRI
jgi:SH3 domain protein